MANQSKITVPGSGHHVRRVSRITHHGSSSQHRRAVRSSSTPQRNGPPSTASRTMDLSGIVPHLQPYYARDALWTSSCTRRVSSRRRNLTRNRLGVLCKGNLGARNTWGQLPQEFGLPVTLGPPNTLTLDIGLIILTKYAKR